MQPSDIHAYVERRRWSALEQVKSAAWLERWRRGPAAQARAMDALRDSVRAIRGAPTPQERTEDLEHHVALAELMRRVELR